jgi:tetratricopeptide (TPR) repeat protein
MQHPDDRRQGSEIPGHESLEMRTSRRRFIRTSLGAFSGAWALPFFQSSQFDVAAQTRQATTSPVNPKPFGHPHKETASPAIGKSWTPLNRALGRFYNHQDRFACERRVRSLADAFSKLQQAIRSGGTSLEECLSPDFRGWPPMPVHEKILRSDRCFEVRLGVGGDADTPPLQSEAFCSAARTWLSPRNPLHLAELECLSIAEAPRLQTAASNQNHNLLTRIRFDMAGDRPSSEHDPRSRWQATGEWELEWQPRRTGGPNATQNSGAADEWAVVTWRPSTMTTVWTLPNAFSDVTLDAFGRDPTFSSHLLRDTNYWRAVLDEASGIDIFGNCGVSVGDADGDGQDEIYLCQPQGLPNRLYRQVRPGVFEDVSAAVGVDLLDATSMALFADVLNRGHQDLLLITQSSPLLFLNDGHGRFTLARDAFPAAEQQTSLTGAAMADYNHDGYLDLYVCAYAYFSGQGTAGIPLPYYDAHNGPPNRLYRNRGDGTFEDVTIASGLHHGNDRFSFACAWCDIDDDSWPDLAVVNDFGRDNLYHNRGDGTFEEIVGGFAGYGSGMSAAFADLNASGVADLYVGNMWSAAGVRVTSEPEFQQPFADVGAGSVRQFAMGNALYQHVTARESESQNAKAAATTPSAIPYSLVPRAAGADCARWAWCSDSFDIENDGQPDLYVVNGFLSSPTPDRAPLDAYLWQEVVALSPHSATPDSEYRAAWNAIFDLAHHGYPWNGGERNVFFLNLGAGHNDAAFRFVDASAATGLDFTDDGRSFAIFDYDSDGDADLVIHSRTGPQLRLLRNDLAGANHSVAIRLTAKTGNRDAIGARIELATRQGQQVRYLGCGSGFLTQHSKELVFGLGADSVATVARVRWPGGATAEFANLEAGYRYHITEGESVPRHEPVAQARESRTATSPPFVGDPSPKTFSTSLIDPLIVPPLDPLQGILSNNRADKTRAEHSTYALLWLWKAGDNAGLETFAKLEPHLPSRLVLWDDAATLTVPSNALRIPPWRADARFRLFASTLLAYLFDYRREPALPTGLLFRRDEGREARLVKIYWGGAGAAELLGDVRSGVPSGATALPFPGRAMLCSFRRDTRTLGSALATAGLFGEAEVYLVDAARQHPTDADTLYNLALTRHETGKIEIALSNVRAALSLRPVFPEAENLCGVLLSQSGQPAAAQAVLERATREAPNLVEAWNNLGYVLLLRGDLPGSQKALGRALDLAPEFPDALDNLGIVAARQGDAGRAQKLFERVLELEPGNPQAGNNLGVLYAKQGRSDLALRTLEDVLDHNPEDGATLLNLARLNLSLHRTAEARRLLESWLARHPDDLPATRLARQIDSSH